MFKLFMSYVVIPNFVEEKLLSIPICFSVDIECLVIHKGHTRHLLVSI